jgi:hypothetical protein
MASAPERRATVEDEVAAEVALGGGRGAEAVGFVGGEDVERGAVGVGVDGDGGDAELAAGADDAEGDLAAVGDEDFAAGALQRVDSILIGLGPVDDSDGVSSFGVFRVGLEDFELPIPGRAELLEVVVQSGNLLEAGDVVGMLFEDLEEAIDGHLGSLLIVRSIEAGNDLLRVGGSEVEPGHGISGIEVHGSLKVVDGLFVFRLFVGLHSFVELIAGLKAFAAGCGGDDQDRSGSQHR